MPPGALVLSELTLEPVDGCPLCAGGRGGPGDEDWRLAITPVHDASPYRQLADSELATKLFAGRQADRGKRSATAIYAALASTEPGATSARLIELQTIAERQARQPSEPSFWDITVAGPVSVTILYEGFLAAAASTRKAGDYAKALRHERDAVQVQAAVTNGSLVALDYLRRKAGCVRFGLTDWSGADSRYEAGRWEDAHDWVTGSFPQTIGRTGASWVHVHNLVLNWVRAEQSGEWGRLDRKSLHRFQPAAVAYGQAEIESALAADLGVCWVQRPDGKGREIAGVSQHLINLFEAQQEAVTADMSAAPVQHEPTRRQAPEPMSLRDDLKQMGWLA